MIVQHILASGLEVLIAIFALQRRDFGMLIHIVAFVVPSCQSLPARRAYALLVILLNKLWYWDLHVSIAFVMKSAPGRVHTLA
jgi:hypothetical protein